MIQLKKGQRFTSEMEPELGLGTLVESDARSLAINFAASNCVRRYTVTNAPLRRVRFDVGDTVIFRDNTTMVVETVEEEDGLLCYRGGGRSVLEPDLSDAMSVSAPRDRLSAGMFDPVEAFDLRFEANLLRYEHERSETMGFMGGRVDLVPHQFYIAGEVAARHVPRILLADETGLGKTIEACLILHRLLLSERISRVVILVPDALVHQWFVEFYRRFNLVFRIFDEDHCRDMERSEPGANPFLSDQLVLCSLGGLAENKRRRAQLMEAGWDMVVVDEAHHVEEGSMAYSLLQGLGSQQTGMMLLSATPEQLGRRTHFSHLRLLDPARYTDFEAYLAESRAYRETASAMDDLMALDEDSPEMREMLDCHGPGRAVFRNTRAVIKGFPERRGILYPLTVAGGDDSAAVREKIQWLVTLLKKRGNDKVLLICSAPDTVARIETAIREIVSIKISLFTETMTIMQRDRSAAWFSEPDGAQLMICSEIGSEGRNFQFAHHLVMFDLPVNPELVEQRIGRLDRIGQQHPISIHVPYAKGSVQEILARWYKEGAGIFENNISGIHQIHKRFEPTLGTLSTQCNGDQCNAGGIFPEEALKGLIDHTRRFSLEISEQLSSGRDRLLELNSYRPGKARGLVDTIRSMDGDTGIDRFMARMFKFYGISPEPVMDRTYRLEVFNASEVEFPGLKSDGMVVTFDRKVAVTRDDIEFLTWDHPMVTGAMELFLGSDNGNVSIAEISGTGEFQILLESVYVLECIAPRELHINRFLARTPIRCLVDHTLTDLTRKHPAKALNKRVSTCAKSWLGQFPEIKEKLLPQLVDAGFKLAEKEADLAINLAKDEVIRLVGGEARRLARLKERNPAIREDEIMAAREEAEALLAHMDTARLRLDSLRLIKVD
ncbi:MAG: DEAD/DEAH box helicase family protein [Desulfobacteraceae bacterium]|nr:DEAD/DEAH box helicase family protein [Desulfobacteraceae bacterium]